MVRAAERRPVALVSASEREHQRIFTKRKLDAASLDEFEDALIRADLGLDTARRDRRAAREGRLRPEISDDEVKAILAAEIEKILEPVAKPLAIDTALKPHVDPRRRRQRHRQDHDHRQARGQAPRRGQSVVLAAGDTFRAAAIEQLKIWGERIGRPGRRPRARRRCRGPRLRRAHARRRKRPTCSSSTPPAACRTRPG